MWMSSLVLTIQLLGYLILTHTQMGRMTSHIWNGQSNSMVPNHQPANLSAKIWRNVPARKYLKNPERTVQTCEIWQNRCHISSNSLDLYSHWTTIESSLWGQYVLPGKVKNCCENPKRPSWHTSGDRDPGYVATSNHPSPRVHQSETLGEAPPQTPSSEALRPLQRPVAPPGQLRPYSGETSALPLISNNPRTKPWLSLGSIHLGILDLGIHGVCTTKTNHHHTSPIITINIHISIEYITIKIQKGSTVPWKKWPLESPGGLSCGTSRCWRKAASHKRTMSETSIIWCPVLGITKDGLGGLPNDTYFVGCKRCSVVD